MSETTTYTCSTCGNQIFPDSHGQFAHKCPPPFNTLDTPHDKLQRVRQFCNKLLSEQQSLPIEFQKLIRDNFWDLL